DQGQVCEPDLLAVEDDAGPIGLIRPRGERIAKGVLGRRRRLAEVGTGAPGQKQQRDQEPRPTCTAAPRGSRGHSTPMLHVDRQRTASRTIIRTLPAISYHHRVSPRCIGFPCPSKPRAGRSRDAGTDARRGGAFTHPYWVKASRWAAPRFTLNVDGNGLAAKPERDGKAGEGEKVGPLPARLTPACLRTVSAR